MEDFPASPACPDVRGPSLSVVIPVRNGGQDFERCLRALRDSLGTRHELIVVDDGSTDDSSEQAARMGALVLRHEDSLGPAAARNAGARAAAAPLVFFLDGDVVVHPHTLARALAHFQREPDLAGLFGSYDDNPSAPGLVSQYRNLLHHFVHQYGGSPGPTRAAHTFWTGCGMIRRDIFLGLGGFDAHLYRRPAIEDIEFGYRLARAGFRVILARDVLVSHRKRWTLVSTIRTDLFHRGIPWMLLMLRARVAESDLNVSPSQRASVALTGLILLAVAASLVSMAALAVAGAATAGILWLNRTFYAFLARKRGLAFVAGAFPLHLIYFLCCGLSVVAAVAMLPWVDRGAGGTQASRVDRGESRAGGRPRSRPARRARLRRR